MVASPLHSVLARGVLLGVGLSCVGVGVVYGGFTLAVLGRGVLQWLICFVGNLLSCVWRRNS